MLQIKSKKAVELTLTTVAIGVIVSVVVLVVVFFVTEGTAKGFLKLEKVGQQFDIPNDCLAKNNPAGQDADGDGIVDGTVTTAEGRTIDCNQYKNILLAKK